MIDLKSNMKIEMIEHHLELIISSRTGLIGDFHLICKLAASVEQKCKQLLCIDIVICKNKKDDIVQICRVKVFLTKCK